ncbi:GNAT family N-acetyltransferase [Janthinobacterium sp. 17J80-10]|uniref:GNAT family N-acetyltransferase n=1 Tax=Janthinobacterium sp. 17J80-10 TaxID=2497863 RepID=UPI0013E8E6E0|nr:GNAT family N-acetyltransferase [Janthinobacterium sp. 17J80-10]
MEIRKLKETELSELLALLEAKAEFDGCPESLRATEENLRDALFSDRPMAHALVAVINGTLVGMATYFSIFSTFIVKPGLWLDDLYVYEAYRGQGIGKALMEHLCKIADENACGRVDWLVSMHNESGQKFYESIGATISDKARLVRLSELEIKQLAAADV